MGSCSICLFNVNVFFTLRGFARFGASTHGFRGYGTITLVILYGFVSLYARFVAMEKRGHMFIGRVRGYFCAIGFRYQARRAQGSFTFLGHAYCINLFGNIYFVVFFGGFFVACNGAFAGTIKIQVNRVGTIFIGPYARLHRGKGLIHAIGVRFISRSGAQRVMLFRRLPGYTNIALGAIDSTSCGGYMIGRLGYALYFYQGVSVAKYIGRDGFHIIVLRGHLF